METTDIWNSAVEALGTVSKPQLLIIAVLAMVVGWLGTALVRRRIPMGRLLGSVSTITLAGVLIAVVLQSSAIDRGAGGLMIGAGVPDAVVDGGETRVDLAPDGHYWVTANINGVEADFLVDTGATFTAISSPVAERAGLENKRAMPVQINTANGAVTANVVTVPSMRFGNITANNLDAVTSSAFGNTNVIGMNLLSQLGGWRVKDQTLILTPAGTP